MVERKKYVDSLLHRVSLGPTVLAFAPAGDSWTCRTCGDQQALVEEKNILLGMSVGKFYNQIANQPHASIHRICVRCALYAYLGTKLFGATTSGKFPVPKQGNMLFHYGHHSAGEIRTIGRQLAKAIGLIKEMDQVRIEAMLAAQKDQERQASEARPDLDVLTELMEKQAQTDTAFGEADLDRLARLVQILATAEGEGTCDLLKHVAECQVIDLGMGSQRLVVFALPTMKDDLELANKRFVRARLVVYALIGFLQDASN